MESLVFKSRCSNDKIAEAHPNDGYVKSAYL